MQLIKRIWCRFFGHKGSSVSLFRASIEGGVKCDRCDYVIPLGHIEWE